jgi:hypothetical protein
MATGNRNPRCPLGRPCSTILKSSLLSPHSHKPWSIDDIFMDRHKWQARMKPKNLVINPKPLPSARPRFPVMQIHAASLL